MTTDQRLVDRDYGPWTGASKESVVARRGSVDNAPGVEPQATVLDGSSSVRALPLGVVFGMVISSR